jgi:hypothetical protein
LIMTGCCLPDKGLKKLLNDSFLIDKKCLT